MSVTRALYRERQRLSAADLRLEQDYRLGLAGRHHLTHHQWGVVRGLHILKESAETFVLTPGVAIDGYGREILVLEPVPLAIPDPEECWDVFLYYCEFPEQVPPDRACQDDPAPRIGQRFKWVVEANDLLSPPSDPDDLTRARAAGRLAGLPPWPVLVARVGTGCPHKPDPDDDYLPPLIDYSRTRYVRHRAALIQSPTGRASLQLGISGRTDVYHFSLSTRDNGRGLVRRLAIDRDRTVHVWRPLVIAGTLAVGQAVIAQQRVIRVVTGMPAGIGRRIRIEGLLDPTTRMLSASLHDVGDPQARERPALAGSKRAQATRPLSLHVLFGAARSADFKLFDADDRPALLVKRERRRKRGQKGPALQSSTPAQAPERISMNLTRTGGKLFMGKKGPPEVSATPWACADVDRVREAAGLTDTPVVQFKPAKEITEGPLAREVHAVTTSKPSDPVPQTELRLSGGAEDESDASSRVTVGGWLGQPPNKWLRALRMDGGRRLEIPASSSASTPERLLDVEQTVYLPPIGKDDPLLPDLLAMAFIAGLRQVSGVGSAATVTLSNLPAKIVRGADLAYTINVTWPAAVEVKHCIETVTGTAGTGDMAFRSIVGIDKSHTKFDIEPRPFTHSASKARIEIQILLAVNKVPGVAFVRSSELEVV